MTPTNIFDLADLLFTQQSSYYSGFPFYNIVKCEKEYTLEFAVAGYSKEELKVVLEKNKLVVKTELSGTKKDAREFTHRGITKKPFKLSWVLPEYYEVDDVKLVNGILSVGLIQNIPEEAKPKTFTIS